MRWQIVKDLYQCPKGFAVVSTDGEFDSCHFTRDDAAKRITMLYKIGGIYAEG